MLLLFDGELLEVIGENLLEFLISLLEIEVRLELQLLAVVDAWDSIVVAASLVVSTVESGSTVVAVEVAVLLVVCEKQLILYGFSESTNRSDNHHVQILVRAGSQCEPTGSDGTEFQL